MYCKALSGRINILSSSYFRLPFGVGDSGSIIYTEAVAADRVTIVRDAVGMLKGLRPGTGEGSGHPATYEATVLYPTLNAVCGAAGLTYVKPFPPRPTQDRSSLYPLEPPQRPSRIPLVLQRCMGRRN